MPKKSVIALLSILALLMVVGCGGGSDPAQDSNIAAPPPTDPPTFSVSGFGATQGATYFVQIFWDSTVYGVKLYRADNEYGPYTEIFDAGFSGPILYNDYDVQTQHTYWYRARLYATGGLGPHSAAVSGWVDPDLLDAPGNVQASAGNFLDRVQVTWEQVTGADQYAVSYTSSPGDVLAYVDGNTWTDWDVTPGTDYFYTVRAVQGTNIGPGGSSGAGWAEPGNVTDVTASDGLYTDKVNIQWDYGFEGLSFNVYRADSYRAGWADLDFLGSSIINAFNDSSAMPGETWWYYVLPVGEDHNGSIVFWPENVGNLGPDDGYVGTTNVPPPAPEWTTATQGTWPYDIYVNWAPVLEADFYKLWVQDENTGENPETSWSILAETQQPWFRWTMTTPDFLQEHSFRVQACIYTEGGNDYLCSGFGDVATGWTAPGPPIVDNLNATAGDTTQLQGILVTWDDIGSESDWFVMERRDGETGSYYPHQSMIMETYFIDSSIVPGQLYGYRVAGVNEYGQGEWDEFFGGYYPLGAPENVRASDETYSGMILLNWAPVWGADAYEVWRFNEELGETPTLIATVGSSNYPDSLVSERGVPYGYYVRAIAYNGTSPTYDVLGPFSATVFGTAGFNACAGPDYPTNVTATQGGPTVEVEWDTVPGVNYYNIYRAVSENGKYELIGREFGDSSDYFEDLTAEPLVQYWYMVRAADNCGFSPHSESPMGFAFGS